MPDLVVRERAPRRTSSGKGARLSSWRADEQSYGGEAERGNPRCWRRLPAWSVRNRARSRWEDRILFSKTDGIDVRPHERKVGFVFQDLALWPHLSAVDQVYLVGHPAGLTRVEALSLLESVGLGGLGSRRPGQLSGGEQQRLAIARALAGKPSTLLLDRTVLFPRCEQAIGAVGLLRRASTLVPGPTIYVTHSGEDARALAEAAFTLESGTLAESECPWEENSVKEHWNWARTGGLWLITLVSSCSCGLRAPPRQASSRLSLAGLVLCWVRQAIPAAGSSYQYGVGTSRGRNVIIVIPPGARPDSDHRTQ